MEAALNQTTFLTQAQALLGKAISEHTTQQNAEVKSIINTDRQVAPKQMPPGARIAVNKHKWGAKENLRKHHRTDLENGIKLTIVNHVRLAWKYRVQHDRLKKVTNLPQIIMHMLDDGYYIDPSWLNKRGTEMYLEVFRTSCKAGKLTYSGCVGTWKGVLWRPPN